MPYKSKAQQGYFHAHESEIGPAVVAEYDAATKGMKGLPKRTGNAKKGKGATKKGRRG